jgi:small nuclear ribonucleoprotein (snRNP)-like protein
MKTKGGKPSTWSWERQTNVMVRRTEWRIPLNFGGHDGENTVGELKDLLKLLPEEATFSVSEDEVSGRETIYISHIERRNPTDRERLAEMKRVQDEVRLHAEQAASIARLRAVQAKTKARRKILGELQAVDGAINMVMAEPIPDGVPGALADREAELEELLAEKHRLQTDLLQV